MYEFLIVFAVVVVVPTILAVFLLSRRDKAVKKDIVYADPFDLKNKPFVALWGNDYEQMMERIARGEDEEPEEVPILLELLAEAYKWGLDNGYPLKKEYPQYEKIRAIGTKLEQEGGKRAMQRVFLHMDMHNHSLALLLSSFWDSVGKWRD